MAELLISIFLDFIKYLSIKWSHSSILIHIQYYQYTMCQALVLAYLAKQRQIWENSDGRVGQSEWEICQSWKNENGVTGQRLIERLID